MAISEITEKLLAKKEKGLNFADLEKVLNRDEGLDCRPLLSSSHCIY